MIITKIEPVKLRYYPQKPLRDGLARIPSRDVFLLKIETDEEIYGMETCWYSRSVWRIQMTGLNLKNTAEIRSCPIRRLMKGRSLTFGIRK